MVTGRAADTEYESYAVADDGAATVVSPTWSFTTGAARLFRIGRRTSTSGRRPAITTRPTWSQDPGGSGRRSDQSGDSFDLIDLASGSPVGATLQVDNSGINTTSDNGADFSGGPAFGVFNGIVDAQGVYSFNEVGDVWQEVNLSGLDPSKRYEVVTSSNRDQGREPPNVWTQVELLGADAVDRGVWRIDDRRVADAGSARDTEQHRPRRRRQVDGDRSRIGRLDQSQV